MPGSQTKENKQGPDHLQAAFQRNLPNARNEALTPAAKRFHFECPCPFWIMGTLPNGERVPRQSLGVYTLKKSEAVRDAPIHQRAASTRTASGENHQNRVHSRMARSAALNRLSASHSSV